LTRSGTCSGSQVIAYAARRSTIRDCRRAANAWFAVATRSIGGASGAAGGAAGTLITSWKSTVATPITAAIATASLTMPSHLRVCIDPAAAISRAWARARAVQSTSGKARISARVTASARAMPPRLNAAALVAV
jgi:hypothetical protein